MAWANEQNRLTLTVFDEAADLWNTVAALLTGGVTIEQMCIVALATLLPRFTPKPALLASVQGSAQLERKQALYSRMQDWPMTAEGGRIVATTGALLPMIRRWQAIDKSMIGRAQSSIRPKVDIEGLVRDGMVALIVRPTDLGQQLSVTRALLAGSKQRVLSIELREPAIAAATAC